MARRGLRRDPAVTTAQALQLEETASRAVSLA